MKFLPLFLYSSLLLSVHATDLTQFREWKNNKGQTVEAKMLKFKNNEVTMQRKNGKVVKIPVNLLSKADQDLLKKWKSANPKVAGIPTGPFNWDSKFNGDATPDIEYINFDKERNAHLYKTKYFDFYITEKMTNSTVSKCVAVFDCIVGALNDMPLELNTVPGDGKPRYEAILVATDAQYMKLGGMPNSGGFFAPSRNLTVIPFKSMGIVKKGNNFVFDGKNTDFSTLIHELTHHSVSHWKSIPAWASEGMADYMAAMSYRSGSFNYSNRGGYIAKNIRKMKKYVAGAQIVKGGVLHSLKPEFLFKLNRRTWNATLGADRVAGSRQYVSSMVLFYYFCHIDADGDGENFIQYMHAHENDVKSGKIRDNNDLTHVNKYLLRGRSYKDLEEDMVKKLSKKGIKVKFS